MIPRRGLTTEVARLLTNEKVAYVRLKLDAGHCTVIRRGRAERSSTLTAVLHLLRNWTGSLANPNDKLKSMERLA